MAAFGSVSPPKSEDMLQKVYECDDAYEMEKAFRGKHWTEIPISILSYHREIIIALSGIGYRAYLPAYLTACLAGDEIYGPGIRGYILHGLHPLSQSEVHVSTTRERLSLLDQEQRNVIANVLRYLEDRWKEQEAGEILREWEPL
jgi:hypothetical protein